MALIKGTNAYVNLNEAGNYFDDRIDATAWTLNEDKQEAALITATTLLEQEKWRGQSVSFSGASLSWPRSGNFVAANRNRTIIFDSNYAFPSSTEKENAVPIDIQLLRKSCYELAMHLISNEGILGDSASVQSLQAGPIKLDTIRAASIIPRYIRTLYADMSHGGSQRQWDAI